MLVCLGNIAKSKVSKELVELAATHTKTNVAHSPLPDPDDLPGPTESFFGTYTRLKDSVWTDDPEQDFGAFWEEFDRLARRITTPINEPVLPDDHPMHPGYLYVKEGKPFEFMGPPMTVGRYRTDPEVNGALIYRCDLIGRQIRLPLKIEPNKQEISGHEKTVRKKNKTKSFRIRKMTKA